MQLCNETLHALCRERAKELVQISLHRDLCREMVQSTFLQGLQVQLGMGVLSPTGLQTPKPIEEEMLNPPRQRAGKQICTRQDSDDPDLRQSTAR